MRVKIKETGEIKDLGIIDPKTGVNYVADFIGNTGALGKEFLYNEDEEYYEALQDDVEWWENVIEAHEHIDDVLMVMSEDLPEEIYDDIHDRVQDSLSQDLDYWYCPGAFDAWLNETMTENGYGYELKIYSDGSIGFVER